MLGVSGLLHLDRVLAVFVAGLTLNAQGTGEERLAELKIDETINHYLVLLLLCYLTLEAQRLDADPRVLAAGTLVIATSPLMRGTTTALGLPLYRRSAARKRCQEH